MQPDDDHPEDWRGVAAELAEAIRLTREYVQPKVRLPALPGWSWYDAMQRYREAVAAAGGAITCPDGRCQGQRRVDAVAAVPVVLVMDPLFGPEALS